MVSRRRTIVAVGLLALVVLSLLVVPRWPGGHRTRPGGPTATPTLLTPGGGESAAPSSVRVAFIADAGMTEDSRAVLDLIDRENADLLVHSGDFDYHQDPAGWNEMLNEELGPDFPVVATIGNHDVYNWSDYQTLIRERTARAENLSCTGDVGLQATCTYRNVTVVQSSIGMCDLPEDADAYPDACGEYASRNPQQYVTRHLGDAGSNWRICSWHKVNHDYQVGDKGSEVPASMYDACRRGGGEIIATGHDHAYARTYPMRSFVDQTVADTDPPYTVGGGTTFALVTGASGHSFYDAGDTVDAEWWAKTHTDGEFGAFFCDLRSDGTGTCYFETVDGEVIDGPFDIRRATTEAGGGRRAAVRPRSAGAGRVDGGSANAPPATSRSGVADGEEHGFVGEARPVADVRRFGTGG